MKLQLAQLAQRKDEVTATGQEIVQHITPRKMV